ncbi:MAG: hypothetical protein RJA36_2873 [Pseudomonadota bacterium]|jgi:xanthine dehydrogenase small subunit
MESDHRPMQALRFVRRGTIVSAGGVAPDRTLLSLLREDLGLSATKEGCNEGDCGACTVVLAEASDGQLRWRAVNSCIRLAHSVHGMALWTAEDLARDPLLDLGGAALHPAQRAMVDAHGSQCGFCTPGFVMSLFALYQNHIAAGEAVTRDTAQAELSGNLCRCTGYRPIVDAAQAMAGLPLARVDEAGLIALLRQIPPAAEPPAESADDAATAPGYWAPSTLGALLRARACLPAVRLVAGATDLALAITKGLERMEQLLDLTRVAELRQIGQRDGLLRLGAAVTVEDAFAELACHWPQLSGFAQRFAGLPVRNSGTLAGNVANGSPIGDSMPLLIALGARLVLARWDVASACVAERRLALEDFYTGYRRHLLGPDEVLAAIELPLPARQPPAQAGPEGAAQGEWLRAYKVSKRFDDDISAVCLALSLRLEGGRVLSARIGAGGVAATPARARHAEAALTGQPWNAETVRAAMAVLRDEFTPLSDLRASAAYRRTVLANLLWRSWLESQGDALPHPVSLAGLTPLADEAKEQP